jgi:serine acetyltransferase
MSNATTQEPTETKFITAEEEVKSLRAAYVLADNGWLEAAVKNDPALNKYGETEEGRIEKLRQMIEKSPDAVELLYYPGLTAMAAHEKANELYKQAQAKGDSAEALADYAAARRLSEAAKTISGEDIHPGATVAKNTFIDHCLGGVIGETAIVGRPPKIDDTTGELTYGEPCFLLQGVTLGGGTTVKKGRRHPALYDGVTIGSNANVYGACDIGDYVKIKTGATIIDSDFADCEPDKRTEVGAGAQITKSQIGKGVIIYAEAQIFNCEIGEGAVIGPRVKLNGVTVPAGARIYEIEQPKLVVYDQEHQGMVTAREKEVTPKEGAKNTEKALQAPVFATLEEIAAVPNWTDKLVAAQKASELEVALR